MTDFDFVFFFSYVHFIYKCIDGKVTIKIFNDLNSFRPSHLYVCRSIFYQIQVLLAIDRFVLVFYPSLGFLSTFMKLEIKFNSGDFAIIKSREKSIRESRSKLWSIMKVGISFNIVNCCLNYCQIMKQTLRIDATDEEAREKHRHMVKKNRPNADIPGQIKLPYHYVIPLLLSF